MVLATTERFRDILSYRNGSRPVVYDLTQPRPRALVRRRDRIEVAERLSGLGDVVTELTAAEADQVASVIAAAAPEAEVVSRHSSWCRGAASFARLSDTEVASR